MDALRSIINCVFIRNQRRVSSRTLSLDCICFFVSFSNRVLSSTRGGSCITANLYAHILQCQSYSLTHYPNANVKAKLISCVLLATFHYGNKRFMASYKNSSSGAREGIDS